MDLLLDRAKVFILWMREKSPVESWRISNVDMHPYREGKRVAEIGIPQMDKRILLGFFYKGE